MKIDEAIKKINEMCEARKSHIKSYKQSHCKTNTYYDLEKEVLAMKTVIEALEDNKADLMTVYLKGVYDERDKWKDRIKDKMEEKEKEIQNYIDTDDIGRFTRENCRIADEVNALKELLER